MTGRLCLKIARSNHRKGGYLLWYSQSGLPWLVGLKSWIHNVNRLAGHMTTHPVKCLLRFLLVMGFLGLFTLSLPKTGFSLGGFAIDPNHSSIVFRVKYLGITFVYGWFDHAMGRYVPPNGKSGQAQIDIRVRVMDIDTGNAVRDDHLQSPDFFHAEKYPWITFKSVSIEVLDRESFRIAGDLRFHGVTRRITIQAQKTDTREDGQGQTRTGFKSIFSIRRSHYGMKRMLGGVGDQVELTVNVQGVQKP
jgi:polyisoprenoid-binding protein YceI